MNETQKTRWLKAFELGAPEASLVWTLLAMLITRVLDFRSPGHPVIHLGIGCGIAVFARQAFAPRLPLIRFLLLLALVLAMTSGLGIYAHFSHSPI